MDRGNIVSGKPDRQSLPSLMRNAPFLVAFCLLSSFSAAAIGGAMAPASPSQADGLAAEDRLKSCDPAVAIAAAEEIISSPATLKEPLTLFSPAMVLFQQGKKDEAVFWFYAAQLRTRYQLVFEKGDRGQLLAIMQMTMGAPINNYAFQNIANFSKILDRVLEWDKRTANPFRDKPGTDETAKQTEQIYAGLRDLKAKLAADKETIEAQARKATPGIEQMYARKNPLCREGQLDPAYAKQETQKEWARVIDFVKSLDDVIHEVGTIKDAYQVSSTNNSMEVMPHRYEVSVHGSTNKTIYAIVDVSRSSGEAKFSLVCTTRLSMGYRDVRKDVCAQ